MRSFEIESVYSYIFILFFLHRTLNGLKMRGPSNKTKLQTLKNLVSSLFLIKSLAFFVRFVILNKNNVRSVDFLDGQFACASVHFWNFVVISNQTRENEKTGFFISNEINFTSKSPFFYLWCLFSGHFISVVVIIVGFGFELKFQTNGS